LRLGRYFGMDAQFWINLQARYDLEVEMDALGDSLDSIQPLQTA
ncbi:MAG: addiction module antidote protein, HigA family, partial [Propionibacterium sp.]|nr:addiction module antidote protein, HigA family [Propionibacterium sp.]